MKRFILHKRTKQVLAITLGAVAMASPLLAFASAQDFGDIASNISSNYNATAKFLTGGAYVLGASAVIFGVHKFWQKAHDNGNQIKAMHYTIPLAAGGALIAVAATAGVPVASIFGAGTQGTGTQGTTTY